MYCYDEEVKEIEQPSQHLGHGHGPVPEGLPQFNADKVTAVISNGNSKE